MTSHKWPTCSIITLKGFDVTKSFTHSPYSRDVIMDDSFVVQIIFGINTFLFRQKFRLECNPVWQMHAACRYTALNQWFLTSVDWRSPTNLLRSNTLLYSLSSGGLCYSRNFCHRICIFTLTKWAKNAKFLVLNRLFSHEFVIKRIYC